MGGDPHPAPRQGRRGGGLALRPDPVLACSSGHARPSPVDRVWSTASSACLRQLRLVPSLPHLVFYPNQILSSSPCLLSLPDPSSTSSSLALRAAMAWTGRLPRRRRHGEPRRSAPSHLLSFSISSSIAFPSILFPDAMRFPSMSSSVKGGEGQQQKHPSPAPPGAGKILVDLHIWSLLTLLVSI